MRKNGPGRLFIGAVTQGCINWRFPAKKLEQQRTTRVQDWQGKTRGKEKLKVISISQVMVEKNDTFLNLDLSYWRY